ncbi:hypothetical protein C0993_000321 [Termitomyces sp. T159_Od127]|nr:hypothetical protein C0993_000321 [Termitomyces sp. T159_Od127]
MTGLSDLPKEILLEVFEKLDDLALHRLAQTDRNLRQVIKVVVTGQHLSYLQSLVDAGSLSLDGHTVQGLLQRSLTFTPEIRLTPHHTPQLFKNLEALRTLLLRFERVSCYLRLSPLEGSNFTLSPRWPKLLAEVMNIVVAMSHSQLTVGRGQHWKTFGRPFHYEYVEPFVPLHPRFHDDFQPNLAHSRLRAVFPSLIRPIRRLIEGIVAKLKPRAVQMSPDEALASNALERSTRSCDIALSLPPSSHLKEFHIHSPVLLELPFFHWTMSTLSMSPITKLSFSDSDLTLYDWEYILSMLSIPTLSHISFGCVSIAFPDLQTFLSRHSSITTLDLSRNNAIGNLRPFSSQKLLPNLVHLIANSEYLAHFLEPPFAFPSLQTITMATGYIGSFRVLDYEMRQFNTVLCRIAARGRDVALNLRFVSDLGLYGLNTWLRSIHMRVGTEALDQIPNVAKLEVFVNISPDHDTLVDLLEFFPMFPSLKHLTFSGSFWSAKSNPDAIRRAVWMSLPGLETIDDQRRPAEVLSSQASH